MICDPCRGARHEVCASSVRPDGTERDIVAKTWCDCQHVLPPSSKCALDDCDEPFVYDGLCAGHYAEKGGANSVPTAPRPEGMGLMEYAIRYPELEAEQIARREAAMPVDSDVSNEQHGTVNIPLTEYVKREDAGE